MDWNYTFVPQKYAFFEKADRRVNFPRGRVFGGSSVLNGMNYYRESPEYFDQWESEFGIKNWTFKDVLPFFLRSENNLDPKIVEESNGLHRTGGQLSVSTVVPDKILERYLKAAQMLGYSETFADGRNPFGYTIMQRSIKGGVRQSAATAFLESNSRVYSNLHSIGYSFVTKILFDDKNRAIGVIFYSKGVNHTVRAHKEVIISAGVIGSPHLLMLSGIGPEQHLRALSIPVISNLKIGDNVQNEIGLTLNYDIKDQFEIEKPILTLDNNYTFFVEGGGPLAYKSSGVTCLREVTYHKNPNLSNGCLLSRLGFLSSDLEKLVKNHALRNQWKDYYRPYLGRAYFGLLPTIRRTKSFGTIRLKSDNPFVHPLIDPCVFCNPSDLEDMVKTTKLSLEIYSSPYFQQFVELYKNPIPGCSPCPDLYFCDTYLRCVAQTVTNYVSPIGTCRMGPNSDTNSVVDEKFRVKGVSALRVIDSSIIPISSEQTNAISIMIGERGAQFVKDDNS